MRSNVSSKGPSSERNVFLQVLLWRRALPRNVRWRITYITVFDKYKMFIFRTWLHSQPFKLYWKCKKAKDNKRNWKAFQTLSMSSSAVKRTHKYLLKNDHRRVMQIEEWSYLLYPWQNYSILIGREECNYFINCSPVLFVPKYNKTWRVQEYDDSTISAPFTSLYCTTNKIICTGKK